MIKSFNCSSSGSEFGYPQWKMTNKGDLRSLSMDQSSIHSSDLLQNNTYDIPKPAVQVSVFYLKYAYNSQNIPQNVNISLYRLKRAVQLPLSIEEFTKLKSMHPLAIQKWQGFKIIQIWAIVIRLIVALEVRRLLLSILLLPQEWKTTMFRGILDTK